MNIQLSDSQKQLFIALIVALLAFVGSFVGITYTQQAQNAVLVQQTTALQAMQKELEAQSAPQANPATAGTLGIGQSRFAGAILDGELDVRADGVNNNASIDTTGNLTINGVGTLKNGLTVTGNITTTGYVISGSNANTHCYRGNQTVLGSATVIPATLTAAGISTPAWANEGFAASPGNTYWNHSHTNSAGVVTLNVYQNILASTVTPVAATTSVAMDYEVCGN